MSLNGNDDVISDASSLLDDETPIPLSLAPKTKQSQELFQKPKKSLLNFSALTNSSKSINFNEVNKIAQRVQIPEKSTSVFQLSRMLNQNQNQQDEKNIADISFSNINSSQFDLSDTDTTLKEDNIKSNHILRDSNFNNTTSTIVHPRITNSSILNNTNRNITPLTPISQEQDQISTKNINNNNLTQNTTTTTTNNNNNNTLTIDNGDDDIWDAFEATPLPQKSPTGKNMNQTDTSNMHINDASFQKRPPSRSGFFTLSKMDTPPTNKKQNTSTSNLLKSPKDSHLNQNIGRKINENNFDNDSDNDWNIENAMMPQNKNSSILQPQPQQQQPQQQLGYQIPKATPTKTNVFPLKGTPPPIPKIPPKNQQTPSKLLPKQSQDLNQRQVIHSQSQLPQIDTTTIFLSSQESLPHSQSKEQIVTSSSFLSIQDSNPIVEKQEIHDSTQTATNDFISLETKQVSSEQNSNVGKNKQNSSFSSTLEDTDFSSETTKNKDHTKSNTSTKSPVKSTKSDRNSKVSKVSSEETEVKMKSEEIEESPEEEEKRRHSRMINQISNGISTTFDSLSSDFKRLFFNELNVLLKAPVFYPIPDLEAFKENLQQEISGIISTPINSSPMLDRIKDDTLQIMNDNLGLIKTTIDETRKQKTDLYKSKQAKMKKLQQKIQQLSNNFKDLSQNAVSRLNLLKEQEQTKQMSDIQLNLNLNKTLRELQIKEMELESKDNDISHELNELEQSFSHLNGMKHSFYLDIFNDNYFSDDISRNGISLFNIRTSLLSLETDINEFISKGFISQSQALEKSLIKETKENEQDLAYIVRYNAKLNKRKTKKIV